MFDLQPDLPILSFSRAIGLKLTSSSEHGDSTVRKCL